MTSISVLNGAGGTVAISATGLPDGSTAPNHCLVDANGTVINPASDDTLASVGQGITEAVEQLVNPGSVGTGDFSNGAPTLGSLTSAGLQLLATIPATPGRLYVEVQNQSASLLTLVRDDGTSNVGLGVNASVWLLDSKDGQTLGVPGTTWSSHTFKGRLRIYGPASTQFAAYQD